MKLYTNIILTLYLILLLACQNMTNAQAPESVKTTFKLKYPGENDPDWPMEIMNLILK